MHRAVFPIRDWAGKIYGVTRRLYWTGDYCFRCKENIRKPNGGMMYSCKKCSMKYAKYLHSSGMHRNDILYGEWLYKENAIPVLVEGTTDAMKLWQHGVRAPLAHPFALLGACPGFEQVVRLFKKTDRPVVVLRDNDPPTPEHPRGPGAQLYVGLVSHAKKMGDSRPLFEVTPLSKDAGGMLPDEAALLLRFLEDVAAGLQKPGRYVLDREVERGYTESVIPHDAGRGFR